MNQLRTAPTTSARAPLALARGARLRCAPVAPVLPVLPVLPVSPAARIAVIALIALSSAAPSTLRAEPLRGDVDRNARIEITDAVNILNSLFLGGFTIYCAPAGDVNADGATNISDPVRLLGHLFLGDPAPPALSGEEVIECSRNDPPALAPLGVHVTYPGMEAAIPIQATDPQGDALAFELLGHPDGATLDASTGIARWTPREDQLGPAYLDFAVSDEAEPPNRVEGRVVFQVLPLDPCARPVCDPALGCEPGLAPLTESCCGSPGPRVAEPEVGCPAGAVLHVGRNPRASPTIGRIQNCDLLRLVPLGQGGHTVDFHLQMRCLAVGTLGLRAILETQTTVLFDYEFNLAYEEFESGEGGFLERRGLRLIAEGFFAEAQAAQFTVRLTDIEGTTVERKVRVVLTRGPLEDLP